MKKIIHIASDEKFINSAYWQFNKAFPEENTFYLIVDEVGNRLKHVQLNDNFILIESGLKNLKKLAISLSKEQLIVVHGLDYFRSFIVQHLDRNCKVIWMVWGAEVYNNPKIVVPSSLYGPQTYSAFIISTREDKIENYFKDSFRKLFYKLKHKTEEPNKLILSAIKRANYCAILYKEEHDFIRKSTGVKNNYLKFSYYPIELMVGNTDARITGNNILVGNSASETNNHLEAILRLKQLQIKGQNIIVPLSYGNQFYGKKIIEKGKKIFGDNFIPLIDFMPLHDYNEYLEQCGIVVMNHYRQQAVGNVLAMLWMGAKVFLDEKNTLYHYLRRLGIYIFSISKDLIPENPNCLELLTPEQQDQNRKILKNEINEEALIDKLKLQLGQFI